MADDLLPIPARLQTVWIFTLHVRGRREIEGDKITGWDLAVASFEKNDH
jgi:hypothetical protein